MYPYSITVEEVGLLMESTCKLKLRFFDKNIKQGVARELGGRVAPTPALPPRPSFILSVSGEHSFGPVLNPCCLETTISGTGLLKMRKTVLPVLKRKAQCLSDYVNLQIY